MEEAHPARVRSPVSNNTVSQGFATVCLTSRSDTETKQEEGGFDGYAVSGIVGVRRLITFMVHASSIAPSSRRMKCAMRVYQSARRLGQSVVPYQSMNLLAHWTRVTFQA